MQCLIIRKRSKNFMHMNCNYIDAERKDTILKNGIVCFHGSDTYCQSDMHSWSFMSAVSVCCPVRTHILRLRFDTYEHQFDADEHPFHVSGKALSFERPFFWSTHPYRSASKGVKTVQNAQSVQHSWDHMAGAWDLSQYTFLSVVTPPTKKQPFTGTMPVGLLWMVFDRFSDYSKKSLESSIGSMYSPFL